MNEAAPAPAGWLNRTVVGAGLTSLLADACYETAVYVLPLFLTVLGQATAEAAVAVAALWVGLMEGSADAAATSMKLGAGWLGDRLGHRKAIVAVGYALTGVAGAFYALAHLRGVVVAVRVLAWAGKGIRGPLRDAILADAVDERDRGKVFGFHRAGDTVGAIVGPLIGAGLLVVLPAPPPDDPAWPYRVVFLLTLIPGLGAVLAFALLIREERQAPHPARLWASIRSLPAGFRRFLVGTGVYGAGDFAAPLLVLAAIAALEPTHGRQQAAALAVGLAALRNVVYAAMSYPVGALSDRIGRRGLLAAGYAFGGLVVAAFAVVLALEWGSLPMLALLFALAGVSIACEDALRGALTADLVPDRAVRGTAYGVMGTVSGLGDFVSSAGVGALWFAFGPVPGFAAAAALMLCGAVLLYLVR
jgi:MFS family permease